MGRALAGVAFLVPALLSAGSPTPTYHSDVVPVLQKRCQGCHRPGEAAPFSMLSYKDARPWAKAMKEAALTRRMPPWHAEPGIGHFRNDRRLTQAEIDTIVRWADAGAPEGNAKDAPLPVEYLEGWNIGQPDMVFEMPEPFEVPAQGSIDYQWIVIPTGLKEDKWIEAAEVRPGDRSVVHHVIAFYRKPGSKWLANAIPGVPTPKAAGAPETGMSDGSIGGYVPGLPPSRLPPGRATLLPAGSDVVLQMHYTASGKVTRDRTKVGIVFARHEVKERSFGLGVGNTKFVIPAGDSNYRVEGDLTVDTDVRVTGLTPHMHLRGKAFEYRAILSDGTREVLLRVPKYDFNWQITYELAEERVFPKGTRFETTGWFDNSPNNPSNPDPKVEVRFGDQTWDEMMVGFVGLALAPDQDLKKLIKRREPERPRTGGE